jgi:putative aldouronate transport system permease protein
MIKESFGRKAFLCTNNIILFLLAVCTLYPLLYVLFASLSNPYEYMRHTGLLLRPLKTTLSSYKLVFNNDQILTGYINTLVVVGVGTAINMFFTVLGAYFFSRRRVALQKPLFLVVLFTMYFSGGMIPTYFVVRNLGLLDTLWALMLPGAISTYNMIILRSGFSTVPVSLEESAMLDGAGHIRILINVVLPLSMHIIAVIILYYAVAHWNAWFQASIYIKSRARFPLQLVLREILIENDTSTMESSISIGDKETIGETIKYAVIVISTVPILCVYPFLQKYFVKGVIAGAVKG